MKTYKSVAFLTTFLVVGIFQTFATGLNPQDPPLPKRVEGQHVYLWSNKPHLLESDQVASLESQLSQFQKDRGVDISVFVCAGEGRGYDYIHKVVEPESLKSLGGPVWGTKRVIFFFCFNVVNHEGKNISPWGCALDPKQVRVGSRAVVFARATERCAALGDKKSQAVYLVQETMNAWLESFAANLSHQGLASQ